MFWMAAFFGFVAALFMVLWWLERMERQHKEQLLEGASRDRKSQSSLQDQERHERDVYKSVLREQGYILPFRPAEASVEVEHGEVTP